MNSGAYIPRRESSSVEATGFEAADPDIDDFNRLGQELDEALAKTGSELRDALLNATDTEDAVALAQLQPVLKMVAKDHKRVHRLALELLEYLRNKDLDAYRTHEPRLVREIDELDNTLLAALAQLEAFADALILRAKDVDGNPVFKRGERTYLVREADPDVVTRVVTEMNLDLDMPAEDAEKNSEPTS